MYEIVSTTTKRPACPPSHNQPMLFVNIIGGNLVQLLTDDLASKTIWGSCQEAVCWYWDREAYYHKHY